MKTAKNFFFFSCLLLGFLFLTGSYLVGRYLDFPSSTTQVPDTPTILSEDSATSPQVLGETNTAPLPILTDEQKIGQILAIPLDLEKGEKNEQNVREFIASYSAGVVVIYGERLPFSLTKEKITGVKAVNPNQDSLLQPLIAVDHEGGLVQRLAGNGFTPLPDWSSCLDQDENTIHLSATQLRQAGVDVVLGPVVDVLTPTIDPEMKPRVCSDKPEVVQAEAQKFITDFQNEGIIPTLKHYPGIGSVHLDLHKKFGQITNQPLEKDIFQNLLQENPNIWIMSTHVGMKNVAEHVPCSLSQECLSQVSLGPSQILFTDGIDMPAASFNYKGQPKSIEQIAIESVEAGNTVIGLGDPSVPNFKVVFQALLKKYQASIEFKQKVDQNVQKILTIKQHRRKIHGF